MAAVLCGERRFVALAIYRRLHPHLLLRLKDCDPDRVFIISGRGLGRANLEQTAVLGERLKDFLTPSIGWDEKTEKRVDVEAFVDSMRPRRA